MPDDNEAEGRPGAGAVRRWWRPLAGEAAGTALLVLLGCLSLQSAPPPLGAPPPLAHAALGFGFAVAALVQVFGGVSGAHLNPAVSLAALLAGELRAGAAAAYALAQCAGATLGFGALLATVARPTGATRPAPGVHPAAAAALEAVMTGSLALLCCSAWRPAGRAPAHDPAMPIKFGLLVAGLVYSGGSLTGTSLNPARSLAPALLLWQWEAHWVYWVGPLAGAALAALLYRFVLAPIPSPSASRTPHPHPLPETLPLHDKPAP